MRCVTRRFIRGTCQTDEIRDFKPSGVVLSGGPESVNLDDPPRVSPVVFELGVPVLGICYGMQTMASELGGKVEASEHREFGYAEISPGNSNLFGGLSDGENLLKVWMSHGDRVEAVPERLRSDSEQPELAAGRHGRQVSPLLRCAVSSRSDAHAARPAHD